MRGWVTKLCTEIIANDIMKSIIVSNLRANAKNMTSVWLGVEIMIAYE